MTYTARLLILALAVLAAAALVAGERNGCKAKRARDYPEILNTEAGFILGLNKLYFNAKTFNQSNEVFATNVDALLAQYLTEDVVFQFPLLQLYTQGRAEMKNVTVRVRAGGNWGERSLYGPVVVECVAGDDDRYVLTKGDAVVARSPAGDTALLSGYKTFGLVRDKKSDDFMIEFIRFDVVGPVPSPGGMVFLAHP